MAASSYNQSFQEIKQSIARQQLAPIYILSGEEGYFIDELCDDFENLIPESERDFNFYALYAQEITAEVVMATCMRFPMMADRQVVILKEAQALRTDQINRLQNYAAKPNPTTILVVCFRGEKAKGKEFLDQVKSSGGILFESKRPTERNIDSTIAQLVRDKGLNIEPKGIGMLRDFIGLDIAKLYNEINKMALVLGKGAMITPESIEQNIGISKDFNNFELVDAIATKDSAKIFKIINYFSSNPKKNPTVLTVSAIFSYFSNLMICQFSRDKSPNTLMGLLGIKWPKQLERYTQGMRNYNAYKTIEIISALREFDTKSKGIGSRQSEWGLLHDLMFKIITCSGKIEI